MNEMIYQINHILNCGNEIKSYDPPSYERNFSNRPRLIYQYSGVAMRFYGQISRLSSVFFVSQVSYYIYDSLLAFNDSFITGK